MTAADTLAADLEREHREIDEGIGAFLASRETLEAIEAELCAGGGDGPLAASSETLLRQLGRHNSKEESIVYPQADAVLTGRTSAGLSEFLAMSRVPVGWVCARADGGGRP